MEHPSVYHLFLTWFIFLHLELFTGKLKLILPWFTTSLVLFQIVSASQAGDIQFLDIRNHKDAYLTIDAHRGSLSALAVHRHAPIIASGSAKQLIKVFSLEGEQLGTIRYHHPSFMAQKIGSVNCLTFHPYQVLLAAGSADACVSIHAWFDVNSRARNDLFLLDSNSQIWKAANWGQANVSTMHIFIQVMKCHTFCCRSCPSLLINWKYGVGEIQSEVVCYTFICLQCGVSNMLGKKSYIRGALANNLLYR